MKPNVNVLASGGCGAGSLRWERSDQSKLPAPQPIVSKTMLGNLFCF